MTTSAYTLALVDDHQIVLDGIAALLKGEPSLQIKFTATQPLEMLRLLETAHVDILLTDVMMPVMNGIQFAKEARKRFPGLKILALSMSGEGELINQMISEADISGYILKNIGRQELIQALKKVADGGIYFNDAVLEEMTKDSEVRKQNALVHLTAREIEIIQLIEKEQINKQIAQSLFISERTVETHRKNIFRKTQTNTLIGLIKYAYEHNLIAKSEK
ncbi:MAG: response regulator transcription factor [Ginsengibacter sp.]